MKYTKGLLLASYCMLALAVSGLSNAQDVDPRGLFTHILAVNDAAREWFHVVPIPGEPTGRYYLTDIFGAGFAATITPQGEITLDEGGSGSFSDPNNAAFSTSQGVMFTLVRAPLTDASFPLTLDQAVPINPLLVGDWDILEQSLDVRTGSPIGADFIDVFTLSIEGTGMGMRHTDSLGTWYQGTMDRADRAIIRYYVTNFGMSPFISLFDTYPDSDNNFPRDMIGEILFTDINHFEVRLALQGRTNVPFRLQFFLWIRGTRQDPYPIGDLDGDRLVSDSDRGLIQSQIGLDPTNATYNLAGDLDGNRYIDGRDLAQFDGIEPGNYPIGPEISGSWYDPSHNGEGWNLIIIDEERVLVTWFSYQADADEQAWFIGVGRIEGNEIILPELLIPSGGIFGPDFDPATVISPVWGGARLWFDTCMSGGMSWNAQGDYANGGLALVRLSTLAALPCPSSATQKGTTASDFAGHWYDPSHNGEGWLIEVLSETTALVYWFTFDDEGNQVWLVGTGTIDGDTLTVEQMTITSGTRFGAAFDSDQIVLVNWGSLNITLTQCGNASLQYNSALPEFGSGALAPQLLVAYAGITCSMAN